MTIDKAKIAKALANGEQLPAGVVINFGADEPVREMTADEKRAADATPEIADFWKDTASKKDDK